MTSRSKTVAVQGCGHVGYYLAKELHEAGAKLIVTDIDAERVKRVVNEFKAKAVALDEIYGVQADIFAPCALGAILNDKTIPQLKVRDRRRRGEQPAAEERHGDALEKRKHPLRAGLRRERRRRDQRVQRARRLDAGSASFRKADEIYDTMLGVFEIAKSEKIPTYRAADRLAERRLRAVGALVRTWPEWPNK